LWFVHLFMILFVGLIYIVVVVDDDDVVDVVVDVVVWLFCKEQC